jgi:hypothetical protein
VCTFGGSEGVTQTVMGLHHLARARNEKPFAVLVDALHVDVMIIRLSPLTCVSEFPTSCSCIGFGECNSECEFR